MHGRTKHEPPHARLPLSRDARFAVLARVEPERLGLTARVWLGVRLLLEAIELSTTRDGALVQIDLLATKCRCSRRTTLRAAENGRHAGILNWTHERDDEGRQAGNRWSIAWDRLAAIAGYVEPLEADPAGMRADDRERPPDVPIGRAIRDPVATVTLAPDLSLWNENLALWRRNCHSGNAALSSSELTLNQTSSYHPRTNTDNTSKPAAATEGGRPEEILYSLGVDQAAAACRVARDQGCTDEHLLELVAHWQQHGGGESWAAWGAGALCWRIRHARPNKPAARGWPRPAEAWTRRAMVAATVRTAPRLERVPAGERFAGSMLEEFQRLSRDAQS